MTKDAHFSLHSSGIEQPAAPTSGTTVVRQIKNTIQLHWYPVGGSGTSHLERQVALAHHHSCSCTLIIQVLNGDFRDLWPIEMLSHVKCLNRAAFRWCYHLVGRNDDVLYVDTHITRPGLIMTTL